MDKIDVIGTEITIYSKNEMDFISLTDMLKAKDGDFFISDWLRNRNTEELSHLVKCILMKITLFLAPHTLKLLN